MNTSNKEERNVVIKVPQEHLDTYNEYLDIIKKKGSTVMFHNLQVFMKGIEETIEESKTKENKKKR